MVGREGLEQGGSKGGVWGGGCEGGRPCARPGSGLRHGGGRLAQAAAAGCERRPSKKMLVPTCAWAEFSALQLGKGLGPPLKCGG